MKSCSIYKIGHSFVNNDSQRRCAWCSERIKVGEKCYYVLGAGLQGLSCCLDCIKYVSNLLIVKPEHYWKLAVALYHLSPQQQGRGELIDLLLREKQKVN